MRKQRRLYNLCIFLGIAGVMALLVIGGIICRYQHTSPERLPDLAEMEFTKIHSCLLYTSMSQKHLNQDK